MSERKKLKSSKADNNKRNEKPWITKADLLGAYPPDTVFFTSGYLYKNYLELELAENALRRIHTELRRKHKTDCHFEYFDQGECCDEHGEMYGEVCASLQLCSDWVDFEQAGITEHSSGATLYVPMKSDLSISSTPLQKCAAPKHTIVIGGKYPHTYGKMMVVLPRKKIKFTTPATKTVARTILLYKRLPQDVLVKICTFIAKCN